MRFTKYQYEAAIKNLRLAATQLEPDANPCAVCGDSGHMAFECGFNPLVAIMMCRRIADASRTLHDMLHELAGFNQSFGEQTGPAKIIVPPTSKETDPNA